MIQVSLTIEQTSCDSKSGVFNWQLRSRILDVDATIVTDNERAIAQTIRDSVFRLLADMNPGVIKFWKDEIQ